MMTVILHLHNPAWNLSCFTDVAGCECVMCHALWCSHLMGETQQMAWQHPASLHEKFGDRMRNSPAKWQYRENLPRSVVIAKCNTGPGQLNEYRYTQWGNEGANSLVSHSLFSQMELVYIQYEIVSIRRNQKWQRTDLPISYFTFCSLLTQCEPRHRLIPRSIPGLLTQSFVKPTIVFLGNFTESRLAIIKLQNGWSYHLLCFSSRENHMKAFC